jgi:hypothetical protein
MLLEEQSYGQEIPTPSENWMTYNRVAKGLPTVYIHSEITLVSAPPSYFIQPYFFIQFMPRASKWSDSFEFSDPNFELISNIPNAGPLLRCAQ